MRHRVLSPGRGGWSVGRQTRCQKLAIMRLAHNFRGSLEIFTLNERKGNIKT